MMRPMTFEDDRETAVAPGASGVMAAMSGGVDSSVCALLLQEAGYAVRGATMVLRDDQESTCGSSRDVEDARAVCQRLGIPHDAFDLRDRFDAAVVRPFCDAYLEGRTPNPCIACNRFLKFESLQQRRRELGFDYVATGHYAGAGGMRPRDAGSFCGHATPPRTKATCCTTLPRTRWPICCFLWAS